MRPSLKGISFSTEEGIPLQGFLLLRLSVCRLDLNSRSTCTIRLETACGSCYGGVDGHIAVTTLCGELLYYIGDTLQFESEGSDIITVGNCQPEIPSGCTDPWFTEYDPLAIVDDGTCETEVIYGCTDSLAVNYNPDANTLETENNCEFVFGLTDGAGDGWFGSWIGVVQGDEIFGPFTMTPDDGVEKQIPIPLYSGESIEVLFFYWR